MQGKGWLDLTPVRQIGTMQLLAAASWASEELRLNATPGRFVTLRAQF